MAKEEAHDGSTAAAPKKSKKMLIIIIAVLVLVLGGGAGGFMMMQSNKAKAELEKKKEASADGEHDEDEGQHTEHKADDKHPPVFVQLDKFVINLMESPNDKTGVAQIEMQVLVEDAHVGEVMKNYMPIIRNNVLLLLTSKTFEELASSEGKLKLQEEILDAIRKPMPVRKDKGKDTGRGLTSVHFTTFIMN